MISPGYFDNNIKCNHHKEVLCNDLELLLKLKNKENQKLYFFAPEEMFIKDYQ